MHEHLSDEFVKRAQKEGYRSRAVYKLLEIIEKNKIREQLINAGYERLKHFDNNDRVKILKNIIENFSWKRSSWD